jgi:hypothetical protein
MEPAVLCSFQNNPPFAASYAAQSKPYLFTSFHLHLGLPVCIMTCLRVGQPSHRGSIPTRTTDLSVLQIIHTGAGGQPTSYSVGIGGSANHSHWCWRPTDAILSGCRRFFRRQPNSQFVKQAALSLVPTLITGAIPPLP